MLMLNPMNVKKMFYMFDVLSRSHSTSELRKPLEYMNSTQCRKFQRVVGVRFEIQLDAQALFFEVRHFWNMKTSNSTIQDLTSQRRLCSTITKYRNSELTTVVTLCSRYLQTFLKSTRCGYEVPGMVSL